MYIHLINIERVSKHSVIILVLRMVTTCWSWAWTNRTSPSNGVGLGSPLAACSVYGDFTCSVNTVNNLCMFSCQWHAYLCNWGPYVRLAYMPNMLPSWNKVIWVLGYLLSARWRLIRLCGCAGWSESLLGAHAIFRLPCSGSLPLMQTDWKEYGGHVWRRICWD